MFPAASPFLSDVPQLFSRSSAPTRRSFCAFEPSRSASSERHRYSVYSRRMEGVRGIEKRVHEAGMRVRYWNGRYGIGEGKKLGRTGGILIPILLFLLVHGLKRPL